MTIDDKGLAALARERIAQAEKARQELIEAEHPGWPNAVLGLIEAAGDLADRLEALPRLSPVAADEARLVALIRSRIGEEFDNEAHFTAGEAERIAARLEALSRREWQPAQIKPLEWEWRKEGFWRAATACDWGYRVYRKGDGWEFNNGYFDAPEAAKAAAQADYEQRIRSALVGSPAASQPAGGGDD